MIKAAGILIIAKTGRALFLLRGPGGDNPGEWCFPGGRIEDNETAIDAAVRETLEETGGYKVDPKALSLWTRRIALCETTGALPTPAPQQPNNPPATLLDALKVAAQPLEAGSAIVIPGDEVDFTTFILRDVEEFTPDVEKSGEHVAYAWTPIELPPAPMHPGCRIACERFAMNELGVAQAIRDGQLTSPQRYGNFVLYAIRITGTGVAYRGRKLGEKKLTKADAKGKRVDAAGFEIIRDEEFAYRNPGDYLTDEFLARCNGLPVVLEHPAGNVLTSDEWNDRAIGTIFLPYILGEEVWGIAKIYDATTIAMMEKTQLSTSPGVVWRDVDENTMTKVDGHNLLLEGKPGLMDHIAVCWQGVWDKGGEPKGILAIGDEVTDMDKELQARLDAIAAGNKENATTLATLMAGFEKVLPVIHGLKSRADADDEKAMEKTKTDARKDADGFNFSARKDDDDDKSFTERHDAEESALCDSLIAAGEKEDKARKDAKGRRDEAEKAEATARKDAEEEKARKDAEEKARVDAAGKPDPALLARIAELEATIKAPKVLPSDDEVNAFGAYQSRADSVYTKLGTRAPMPHPGHQSLAEYRRSILADLKKHSARYKDAEIGVAAVDSALFKTVEDGIFEDALKFASSPARIPAGELRMKTTRADSGHIINEWEGSSSAWMDEIAGTTKQGSGGIVVPNLSEGGR